MKTKYYQSLILAIDIGTTSAKALLVSPDGNVIATHQEFYETKFPSPGIAEQDPDLIFNAVWQLLKSMDSYQKPVGICFSAAMHSLMAVDEKGNPLTPLMIWSDTRSTAQSRYLHENKLAVPLYETTGTPVHPMSPLCKLLWMKENQPQIYRSSFKFISIKEYILFRLNGKFIVDYSIASATGLFDLDLKKWSPLALKLLELNEERFSAPVNVHSIINVKNEVAKDLGLEDVPLMVGASDGCLAQLGSDAMGDDDLSITLGTSGAVRVSAKKRKVDPAGKIFNYILDDEAFVCGGATNCGTALLNWYSMNMDTSASTDISDFVDQAMSVAAGCNGLLMLPFLLGERAPIYRPEAKGVFFGISIAHTKMHFQRALLEGICFQLRWISECVEESFGSRKRILISGGITRSENWLQLLSNVLGKTLTIQESQDASAMGAARMGFKAMGISHKFNSPELKIYQPESCANLIHSHSYDLYKKLYVALEKIF